MGSRARLASLAIATAVLCSDRVDTFSLSTSRRSRPSSAALRERSTDDPSLQPVYEGLSRYRKVRKETDTLYDVLRCSQDATREELKRAYFELARETHPDALIARSNGGAYNGVGAEWGIGAEAAGGAFSSFEEVAHAWNILSDERERMRYDKRLQAKRLTTVFEALVSWAADLVGSFIPSPANTVRPDHQRYDDHVYVETWETNEGDKEYYVGSEQKNYDQNHFETWGANEFDEKYYGESEQCYQEQTHVKPWEPNEMDWEDYVKTGHSYHGQRLVETWISNEVDGEYFVAADQNNHDQEHVETWEGAGAEFNEPASDKKWAWKFW